MSIHVHIHTRTHTRTHIHTHIHASTHTHAHTYAHAHTVHTITIIPHIKSEILNSKVSFTRSTYLFLLIGPCVSLGVLLYLVMSSLKSAVT